MGRKRDKNNSRRWLEIVDRRGSNVDDGGERARERESGIGTVRKMGREKEMEYDRRQQRNTGNGEMVGWKGRGKRWERGREESQRQRQAGDVVSCETMGETREPLHTACEASAFVMPEMMTRKGYERAKMDA
ncbi:hypothetical protein ACLOJK_032613 [Asimina triloba]